MDLWWTGIVDSVAGWDRNHDFWKEFFPPNLLFFLRDGGGQHFLMYGIYLVQGLENASAASSDARLQTRAKIQLPKRKHALQWRSVAVSRTLWVLSWGGGGQRPNFPPWPRLCAPWKKEGVCWRNPQNMLRIKPWTIVFTHFPPLPAKRPCAVCGLICAVYFCYRWGEPAEADGPREHRDLSLDS